MSLPLEDEIMEEIGLGRHYYWYNGSGSCIHIRQAAVDKLYRVLLARWQAGEPVAFPNLDQVELAHQAATIVDREDYTLTLTWQACANVIRWHMAQWHLDRAGKKWKEARHTDIIEPLS